MTTHKTANLQNGFTLMEVLVVLVLVSLLSGLLMDGFGYVLRLRSSVTQQLKKQRILQLQEYWLRNLLGGLITISLEYKPTETELFHGNASSLEGQSLNALEIPAGIPQRFSLALSQTAELIELKYQTGEKTQWVLGKWPAQKAVFRYLDDQGNWTATWPPQLGVKTQQLPQAIQLQIDSEANPVNWIISIVGPKNPKPTLEELF